MRYREINNKTTASSWKSAYNAILGILVVISLTCFHWSCAAEAQQDNRARQASMTEEIPGDLPWSEKMARSVMKRNPESWMTDFRRSPSWSYTNGLVMLSFQKLYDQNGEKVYYNYARDYADTMITPEGRILDYHIDEFNIDHINAGKILFRLYEDTGDERYRTAIETLRRQLKWQPRTTEGGFWHKLRYPWQMWLDGLYMGAPFYAEYARRFNEPEAFSDIAKQFILVDSKTRDTKTNLLYHGWDESRVQQWADPETGLSRHFWGRAVGWYLMALVDVLEHFPADHPDRQALLDILENTVQGISRVQDEKTGLWYQVLDQGDREGNYLEASASSMFVYGIARAVNQGYLDRDYLPVAQKGFKGLISELIETVDHGEVVIHKCCSVAGLGGDPYRDGSYEYYISEKVRDNDAKATGPFILASIEFEKLGYQF